MALLPVFASEILHVGSLELGWLRAAPSLGAATFLFALSIKPPETKTGLKLLLSVAAFGLCMIGFSLSENLYLSLVLLCASGAFDAVSVVIRGQSYRCIPRPHARKSICSQHNVYRI